MFIFIRGVGWDVLIRFPYVGRKTLVFFFFFFLFIHYEYLGHWPMTRIKYKPIPRPYRGYIPDWSRTHPTIHCGSYYEVNRKSKINEQKKAEKKE